MKKIALISDGWRRLIVYAWVEGIISRIRQLDEDIALYQYNCYGNWSKDALHNAGEYNIYNLPDLSEFDGVILDISNIVDPARRTRVADMLRRYKLPVISLDWYIDGFYYVGADNRSPIAELMAHLYEKHGCRSFVFAGGPEDAFGNLERVASYCASLRKYGLTLEDNPILCGDYTYETGVAYMREYGVQRKPLPDAFVCANDNIAAGICEEAERWGYRVPDDFLVTGFDNLDKAAFFRPQITTVYQEREHIGRLCVDVMMRIWKGENVEERCYIPVTCIYGESCGCPNNGMVDYREHARQQIVAGVRRAEEDEFLMELEAQMTRSADFKQIFAHIVDYFQKLSCGGVYIVVDRKLFAADAGTVFPTEGYDRDDLMVADAFEGDARVSFGSVEELHRHLEENGSRNTYLFTPLHFREQAVGYLILKNGTFLYENPYYYDIQSSIEKTLETHFKQKQLENAVEKLRILYNRDPLTGICNRIAYTDIIGPAFARYCAEGVTCALVFVDADDFKSVNDVYGHEFGDHVLIRIAHVLDEECPEDGCACRYGGDEFIAFFPHATEENANAYMERVQKRLLMEKISVSMGVTLTAEGCGGTIDGFLSLADQNMYRQKQARKKQKNREVDKSE